PDDVLEDGVERTIRGGHRSPGPVRPRGGTREELRARDRAVPAVRVVRGPAEGHGAPGYDRVSDDRDASGPDQGPEDVPARPVDREVRIGCVGAREERGAVVLGDDPDPILSAV